MKTWGLLLFLFVALLAVGTGKDGDHERKKRDIMQDQPRLLTDNGNLIFQCGNAKNIYLRPSAGGGVYIGSDNLTRIAELTKANNDEIARLKATTETPAYLENRLSSLENSLVPLRTIVPTQLSAMQTSINSITTTVIETNANRRLLSLESRMDNLQPTGQVQTTLTTLDSRLSTLESRVSTLSDALGAESSTGLRQRVSSDENSLSENNPGSSNGNSDDDDNNDDGDNSISGGRDGGGRGGGGRGGGGGGGSGRGGRRGRQVTWRRFQNLQNKVQTLENTVQRLQQLLTTNECQSNPCQNAGTCIDTYNGFFCQCPANWQGVTCSQDVNECSIYAGTDRGCQNGATCVNLYGYFRCDCAPNWFGVLCTSQQNGCNGASNEDLCGHGTCVDAPNAAAGRPRYRCICDQGWTIAGGLDPSCNMDINECTVGMSRCSVDPPVPCINTQGSFVCGSCPLGYTGNGFTCTDINECETNNGGCSLAPRVDCMNTRGSRTCGPCPPGYVGDGQTCYYSGRCSINNGGCHPLAVCTEYSGVLSVVCTCPPPYTGNGEGPTGCVSGGTSQGACASNPCQNGVCSVSGSSYTCMCNPGFTGPACGDINECISSPCMNNGTCLNTYGSFTCTCTSDFSGPLCQQEQQGCGGSIRATDSGSFSYPRVPGVATYSHNISCAWVLTTDASQILMISFPWFNLEQDTQCRFDFLQVHDGPTASSHMINKFCGTTPPPNFNSTHNQLYFWFKTDESISGLGFTVSWQSALPVCGAILNNGSYGVINSPGYPGNYPHDRDCVWIVSVQPGNNIMFTFATLAIENHPNCSYDYLEIRSGQTADSPQLNRYCSIQSPAPITTLGPYAYVHFHSDMSLSDRGFHITYAAIPAGSGCGGNLEGTDGTVQSPNYPSSYNNNAECLWVITVGPSDRVSLTFADFDLEGSVLCDYDYLQIFDGPDETSPSMGKLCGSAIPTTYTSSGNTMTLKLRTDESLNGRGFRASYTSGCGGIFTSPSGVLTSPSYPNTYPHTKQCDYLIRAPSDKRVSLTFTNFSLEGSSGCIFDFVQLFDGDSWTMPTLGPRLCGDTLLGLQISSSNAMLLKFSTDGSVSQMGFRATYEFVDAGVGGCGGVLRAPSGNISSPGHPTSYPHGANCTWYIYVAEGLVVQLTFSTFVLEEGHYDCIFDYVAVYDSSMPGTNGTDNSTLMGRFCGNSLPPVLTSTNNYMTVVFSADSSINSEGFVANYIALNASQACGRVLTSTTGLITSPGFPSNYPDNRDCVWTIIVPPRQQITLNVTAFQLENNAACSYDYLEIRNGGSDDSPLIGKFCGNFIPTPIVSHSNRMWLKFHTDGSQSGSGFRIYYDGTSTGCGGDLSTPTGSLVSPNYPSPYNHLTECFWTIRVNQGSGIRINFEDFDVESHSSCIFDYLEIRERDSGGRLLGSLCGNTIPNDINSTTNIVWIKFRTDFSASGRGFRARYSILCNNRLTDLSGVIESPNYPQPYLGGINCSWLIDSTETSTLTIYFTDFNLEEHVSCQYDYVQLLDGEYMSSPSLGRFCGSRMPPARNSSTSRLLVNFVTDASEQRSGFRLEYFTNGCGDELRGPQGVFSSPNYPRTYEHARVCVWKIQVDTGYSVMLTFHEFDMEISRDCSFDYLQIYAGSDETGPVLATLCHTQATAQTYTATGNTMFIKMKTDLSVGGRGFNASFSQIPGGCGGNFSTQNGVIMSKNYPSSYPHNTVCEYLINVTDNHAVVLNITDFDIEFHGDCTYDYLDIYDGPTSNYTRLAHLCGYNLPNVTEYRSSRNTMFIKMKTDYSMSGKGFRATYVAGCGGILNASSNGVVFSPNYPNLYPALSNCSWLITTQYNTDRILLTFTHMDIEDTDNCQDDYVRVLAGNDANAPEIGRYCGNTVPLPITSTGSNLFLIFAADSIHQRTGFRAVYTTATSSCGGEFTALNGGFVSPGYPNSYPPNVECIWKFSASPGNRVTLSFSQFNLEDSGSCLNDYIQVSPQISNSGQTFQYLTPRFCGSTIPMNISAANTVIVTFRSNSNITGQGFYAQWAESYGGNLYGDSGQIASPGYPSLYPNSLNVAWVIRTSFFTRVRITFVNFIMESSDSCSLDYVRILDGPSDTSAELGRFCGYTMPDSLVTSTSEARVEFASDASVNFMGFLLEWQATSENPTPPTLPPDGSTLPPTSGCGGSLVAAEFVQYLQSPGYPIGYASNLTCEWHILAPTGRSVWINITDINLQSNGIICSYDRLLIVYNSGDYNTAQYYCNMMNENMQTMPLIGWTGSASLRFITSNSANRPGFRLAYKAVCGRIIRQSSGYISSPGYPNSYPPNSNCTWTITVTRSKTVSVQFNTSFNIPSPAGCTADYVQLLNGGSVFSPPLLPNGTDTSASGRYCGTTPPVIMETTDRYLTVSFISDNTAQGMGFSLYFQEVSVTCGGSLTLSREVNSGVFVSPNYPQNYPHDVDCIWVITAPANENIQITFVDEFNVEYTPSCAFDYLELRDGSTVTSPLLAKYCGSQLPSTVTSTGNVMFARFFTDHSIPRKGFKALYHIATCGGRFSGQSGTILSPNYPAAYSPNLNCSWIISGPPGHYLTFTVNALSLETSTSCSSDFLEIREYNETGQLIMPRLCGNNLPRLFSFYTSDSFAYLRFITNSNVQSTGFNITFNASVEACGGDLTTPSGALQSPNYPGQYAHSRICEWRITVQEGRRVRLVFDDIQLEQSSTCSWDYVQIVNGLNQDSSTISRVCTMPSNSSAFLSSGNTMLVRFRSDGSVTARGFRARYSSDEEAVCGGYLSTPANITSPGYYGAGNYSNNMECVWRVENPTRGNSSLRIIVDDLDLERHVTCQYDFVEIREGPVVSGAVLEKFCGNNTRPLPLVTHNAQIYVRFHSDANAVGRGFALTFQSTTCGGILTAPNGIITSPNYPSNYYDNDDCAWKILAPEGQRIRLQFTDFSMENDTVCTLDFLEIYNGGLPDSPSIGRFCGLTRPADFISQSNAVRLLFHSDYSVSHRGFRLQYSFNSESCGGLYHASSGNLTSPGFPSNYPANTECVWDINTDNGQFIVLNFLNLTLETSSTCSSDYVEVTDVLSNGTRVVRDRYCGTVTPPISRITSTVNRLIVKFHSNNRISAQGFSATWNSNCGGSFLAVRNPSQVQAIISPGYPLRYPNNLFCNYTITGEPGIYVYLRFDPTIYGLEAGRGACIYDYIHVFGGLNEMTNYTDLGRFCGTTVPSPLSALDGMQIRFRTDSSITNVGFRMLYGIQDCGGVLTQPLGQFGLGPDHQPGTSCSWSITVAEQRVVGLVFITLDLPILGSNCQGGDHVAIYDGNSTASRLIGRFCGDTRPDSIVATANRMLVVFNSNQGSDTPVFSAGYYTSHGPLTGCGGILNQTETFGVIQSLDVNNDSLYEPWLDCRWTKIAADNKIIVFNFTSFSLEGAMPDCEYDYVEIYDGMSTSTSRLGRFCGNELPPALSTTSNVAMVKFHTDQDTEYRGFNLGYYERSAECGGTFNATSAWQNISSPGYPNPRSRSTRCRWVIDSGSSNRQVTLKMLDLSLLADPACSNEYVQIQDVPLLTGGNSIHYCGSTLPRPLDSAGRVVQVDYFVTGGSTSRGFKLSFTVADCNKTYDGTAGLIRSPGYPGNYPPNVRCGSTVNGPANSTLAFYFSAFYIEPHTSCIFDYLMVRNGSSESGQQVAKLCGRTLPNPVFVNASSAYLLFVTDNSLQHPGYEITWVSNTNGLGCGGQISGLVNGTFTSPNYPGNFSEIATCVWTLEVPSQRIVSLNFISLSVPGQSDCSHNFVEVFNGPNVLVPTFGRFCQIPPATLTASGNTLTVRLTSTGSSPAPSFRAIFYS